MATTDIQPFATGAGSAANLQTLAAYLTETARINGFVAGLADQTIMNRAWRQAAFMAAGLANFCVQEGVSVPDDGNLTNLVAELTAALNLFVQTTVANYGVDSGAASAYVVTLSPVPAAYVDGMEVRFFAANPTTGASTINLGPGVVALVEANGANTPANSIIAQDYTRAVYKASSGKFYKSTGAIGLANPGTSLSLDGFGNVNVQAPSIAMYNAANFY